jgi:hypothetical protein
LTLGEWPCFPSAKPEIEAGIRCYALGQPTACVFHMVRSVEYLLRSFVVAVGIRGSTRDPVEYREWDPLIRQARKVAETWAEKLPNKPVRKQAQDVLSSAIADFFFFKDHLRNNVMHGRSGLADAPTALSVITRTRDCYLRLMPYLSERQTASILDESVWTKGKPSTE